MSVKFEPFASDREKRLAYFAQEILQECCEGPGDIDYDTVLSTAERAGLIFWSKCETGNEEEWPEDCELGDPMWQQVRGQLPAGVIELDEPSPPLTGTQQLQQAMRTDYGDG
ncbi:MAG TPA: hypothetical protein V6D20_19300 [Candidatus Obscuribacterales bacterium]